MEGKSSPYNCFILNNNMRPLRTFVSFKKLKKSSFSGGKFEVVLECHARNLTFTDFMI